jgi:hypothetical protein
VASSVDAVAGNTLDGTIVSRTQGRSSAARLSRHIAHPERRWGGDVPATVARGMGDRRQAAEPLCGNNQRFRAFLDPFGMRLA